MQIKHSSDYKDICAIHDALYEFNLKHTGQERKPVQAKQLPDMYALSIYDDNDEFKGGLVYHWESDPKRIFIDYLWLDEKLRGTGMGSKVIEEACALAAAGGACQVDVTTNTFQAPDFYLHKGFTVTRSWAEPTPNFPDNIHYYLVRKITIQN